MPPSEELAPAAPVADADLVAACLAGEREAFARIVERYQRLLCSLAYSATGRVSESEDLAQETFIAAWGRLRDLREPDKLRPWLCGILRHRVSHFRRRFGRDAVFGADPVDAAHTLATADTPAAEHTMHLEEQALLRQALGQLPETYREPLVLFYREGRSIEHVAVSLDLTEDAVKQRLARGRKLLQEQALALVEGALARTTPGRAFTVSVLAALPALAPTPTAGAGAGAAVAAQGGVLLKTTGLAALLASVSGIVTSALQLRVCLDQSRTVRERRAVVKTTLGYFVGSLGFIAGLWLLRAAALRWPALRGLYTFVCTGAVLAFIVAWPWVLGRVLAYFRRLRSEERRLEPERFCAPRDQVGAAAGVYRSRAALFGVPLVHVRYASPDLGDQPVFGWIAFGDRACGLLFACGGWAVAPISVGSFAVGLLSIGAVSVGVLGLGTFSVGVICVGAVAVGFKAYAWLSALGWETARSGGFAVAHLAAEAPMAYARHANDDTARRLLTEPDAQQHQLIFYVLIVCLTVIPMVFYARAVRRRLGPKPRDA